MNAASSRYLLALGDSLAAGYQPADGTASPPIDPSTGYPDQGYPGGYAFDLASDRHLTLVDLACPGETTTSMIGKPARAQCAADYQAQFDASSQLSAALGFLASHKHQVDLATIDLGANDLESCVVGGAPDPSCLSNGAATASRELPVILSKLKHALSLDDPGTPLVGMNYYDPFLGLDFRPGGAKPSAEAFLSLVVLEAYNKELGVLYQRAKVPVANVASAFESASTTPLTAYGSKILPRNVALVCLWTWMCPIAPAKYSPDIHANTTGYGVIARAFEAVLVRS
jgi:lysophospholipase L1-like esterase